MKKISMLFLLSFIYSIAFMPIKSYYEANADTQGAGPIIESNLFNNFYSWRKGKLKDFDSIYLLLKSRVKKDVDGSGNIITKYENSYIDVNRDNYDDIILVDYNKLPITKKGDSKTYYEYQYFYGLLLNSSELNYEVKYRCVYVVNELDSSKTGYYGDCARF